MPHPASLPHASAALTSEHLRQRHAAAISGSTNSSLSTRLSLSCPIRTVLGIAERVGLKRTVCVLTMIYPPFVDERSAHPLRFRFRMSIR